MANLTGQRMKCKECGPGQTCGRGVDADRRYRIHIAELEAELTELARAGRWLIDLADMYDLRLIDLGMPEHRVQSDRHRAGMARARAAIDVAEHPDIVPEQQAKLDKALVSLRQQREVSFEDLHTPTGQAAEAAKEKS